MSNLEKTWSLYNPNPGLNKIFSKRLGISPIVAQILINRGIHTVEEAKDFLDKDLSSLKDPFLFRDMGIAIELVLDKITTGQKILIFGDYDVDGITSTSLLVTVLRRFGANVEYYIPDRKTEGYGLNLEALKKVKDQGFKLIITVDCGITAVEESLYLKEKGIDLIITDHHEAPEELPWARAIINPKLKGSAYPFKDLAGVGVAFKLVQALMSKKFPDESFNHLGYEYLDIVALGTVADIVALKGENRVFVEHGLNLINKLERPSIKALIKVSGLSGKEVTAGHIGFMLAPRLNAIGRLSHAAAGVKFLLTASEAEANDMAVTLDEENVSRQAIENQIVNEAIERIEKHCHLKNEPVIVLAAEGWHSGVIGIVASRIVEKYYRPTILISVDGSLGKGSCRSIKGFNMFEALQFCSDQLLKFGGHKQAAGLSISAEKIEVFTKKINEYALSLLSEKDLVPEISLDCEITLEEITQELVVQLEALEPFGFQNPGPVLMCRKAQLADYQEVGKEGGHLKVRLKSQRSFIDGIGFRLAEKMDILNSSSTFDFAFSVEKNEFRGRTSVQLNLKDIKLPSEANNPYSWDDETVDFVEQVFRRAEECLSDDYYRNIGDKGEFYTKVVGVSFEGRQQILKNLKEGQVLFLSREPTNQYDPSAIRVMTEEEAQVGYLNAALAKNLAPLLDQGLEYKVLISAVTGGGDKNFGLNIVLQKEIANSFEKRRMELSVKRNEIASSDRIEDEIKKVLLGEGNYRPKQVEAIKALQEGNNTLAIFGTGRGKSAVFQSMAASLAIKNNLISIIIYPLRALVNDQFVGMEKKLGKLGLRVYKANGSISELERLRLYRAMDEGEIDIILTTPEFIEYHLEKFQILKEKIGFFVVDESHHIGDMGRPSYRRLNKLLINLGRPLTLAVTATADETTAAEIVNTLNITKVIVDPHVRENLTVVDQRDLINKNGYIRKIVKSGEKTIIYVNSRSKTIELANYLRSEIPQLKDKIIFYNAGLNNETRAAIEGMFRKGELTTVISTSAFGEGIDIPDVKNVILYHLNFNFTEFNQQSGRAGRNGNTAVIHLVGGKRDVGINKYILDSMAPDRNLLAKFYLLLKKLGPAEPITLTNGEFAEILSKEIGKEIQDSTISTAIGIFVELGLVDREIEVRDRKLFVLPQPEVKVTLDSSLRYREGMVEKREFEKFQKFFFNEKEDQLLKVINRPIYPAKYL